MDKPEAYPTNSARIRDATSLPRSPVSPVGSALLLAHGCLTVLGGTTNGERIPRGKPWDRQRISGKLRRKFMSVPGLRRISARLPQNG